MRAALIHCVRPRGTPLTHNASPHLAAYMRATLIKQSVHEGNPHSQIHGALMRSGPHDVGLRVCSCKVQINACRLVILLPLTLENKVCISCFLQSCRRVLHNPWGSVLHLEHVQAMCGEGTESLPHAFHSTLLGH